MKRLLIGGLSALLTLNITETVAAQSPVTQRDSATVSLFEYVTKTPRRNKVFTLDLEMHAGFYADFAASTLDEAAFRIQDIKIDIAGEINDRLFYQYRQKLNGDFSNQPLDNLSASIEQAYVGYHLNDKWTLTAGKQDVLYGGFEYDPNPLFIYEYSDMNEYSLCYLTGLSLGYQPTATQEIRLQVSNSRIGSMEEAYGCLPEGIAKPKVPLFYTLNWNSSYLDEWLALRYSVSAAQQAEGKYMYNLFAGQSLSAAPFYAYFDVLYSRGALDPLGLITELTLPGPEESEDEVPQMPVCVENCDYLSLVAEVQYRFHPKWQLFAKGMYETASVYKDNELYEKGLYRTAWGYQGGLEFYPMADENLHIFLLASGKTYRLEEKERIANSSLNNTARIAVGFVYRLPIY